MSANNRKLTAEEIQTVGQILRDKAAIELLKKIRDSTITEEDVKKRRAQQKGGEDDDDTPAFQGFAHSDQILGEGANKEEGEQQKDEQLQEKRGILKRLADIGLVLEGFHIPLEKKKEGPQGQRYPSNRKISKFQLTNEGLTLLSVVDPEGQQQQSAGQAQQQQSGERRSAVEKFKRDVKKEEE